MKQSLFKKVQNKNTILSVIINTFDIHTGHL